MSNVTIEPDVLERPRQHRENRKKNIGRKVADNQAQAVAKFIRVPPRKARLVMDAVRGKYANDALAFLRFIPNRAAQYISKVLTSAVANAANNHGLNPENLRLVECRVDEGPRMKRVHPRAQGRAYRILKRMSHITVIVEEVEPKPRKPKKTTRRDQPASRRQQTAPTVAAAAPTDTTDATATDTTLISGDTTPLTPEATAPTQTESAATPITGSTETTQTLDAPQGPQTANPATTDEIGAPTTPESAEPTTPSTDGATSGDTQPQTANVQDKTDEIGAPTE